MISWGKMREVSSLETRWRGAFTLHHHGQELWRLKAWILFFPLFSHRRISTSRDHHDGDHYYEGRKQEFPDFYPFIYPALLILLIPWQHLPASDHLLRLDPVPESLNVFWRLPNVLGGDDGGSKLNKIMLWWTSWARQKVDSEIRKMNQEWVGEIRVGRVEWGRMQDCWKFFPDLSSGKQR